MIDHLDCVPAYLHQIADLLKDQMQDAWQWAASDEIANEDAEAIRLELLRSAIRLDRSSHESCYQIIDSVTDRLGLKTTITLYQQQDPIGWNAAAFPLGDQAHVVFHGPLMSELSEPELTAVLAHELGHVLLWQQDDAKHGIANRLLDSLANDPAAAKSHLETARLAKLYAEVFCDRIAYQIVGDSQFVISSLLKIGTQSSDVNSNEYLAQADEILAAGKSDHSRSSTHPEMYVRAKAIQIWAERDDKRHPAADQTIAELIQGQSELESLDLVTQKELHGLTRRMLDAIFSHRWMRTEAALAHAKLFFDDYQPGDLSSGDWKALSQQIADAPPSIKQYVAYLLLDFATSDRECEDFPLAMALELAHRFSLSDSFQEFAKKEMRLRVKQMRDLNENRTAMLATAAANGVKSK